MLQLNHLMLKSNSLEQTSEGLQTRNSFSSGYQSYMHNPHLFPTEPLLRFPFKGNFQRFGLSPAPIPQPCEPSPLVLKAEIFIG